MSFLDGEAIKKYNPTDSTNIQPVSTETKPAETGSSSNINTVFDSKNVEENAKKLGLTKEEYIEIINNPSFATLSPEEQVNFINNYKAEKAKKTTNAEQQPTITETTQENDEMQAEADLARADYEAKKGEYVTDDDCHAVGEYADEFDMKAYSQKDQKEQLRIYVLEYAKNKYIAKNGKADEQGYINDWDEQAEAWEKLSDADKNKLIEQANEDVQKKLQRKSYFDFNKEMEELQTANYTSIALNKFKRLPAEAQLTHKIDYFEYLKEDNLENLLTEKQKVELNNTEFELKAIEYALKERGIDAEVCVDTRFDIVKNYHVNIPETRQKYLEHLKAQGNISEEQLAQLEDLQKYQSFLGNTGARSGELTLAEKELREGNSKFSSEYQDLTSQITEENPKTKEKTKLLANYITEKYKDQPEVIVEHIKDAYQVLDLDLAKRLVRYGMKNPEVFAVLKEDPKFQPIIKAMMAGNIDTVDNDTKKTEEITEFVMSSEGKDSKDSQKIKNELGELIINNSSDNQVECIGACVLSNTDPDVQICYVDRVNGCKNPEHVIGGHQQIHNHASEEAQNYAAVNVHKAPEEAQEEIVHIHSDNSAERTELMINAGIVSQCGEKAQQGVFDTLKNNAEELLPEKQAIQALQTLTDQIPDCAVSNQLGMHKSIMSSKYEDVQTYAASNVYKYDKSVQADAIKVVYESGNTKAMDAVNRQLSKCDPAALQSISKEIAVQLKAMEERHSKEVSNSIGEKLVSMDAAKDPAASSKWSAETRQEKIAQYREKFIKGTPLEKFRMISSLQGVWQQEIIAQIASNCPELMASLISSMGADLFQLQLTPEVRNKIMLEMLRIPDMQADALEYFKDNPSAFSADIKSTCAEMLLDRDDDALKSDEIRNALASNKRFITEPEELSGGKVSNREYYSSGNLKSFWKRDKNGYYIS